MASERSGGRGRRATSSRCPTCHGLLPSGDEGEDRGPRFAPFCSSRCKRIDLATWLGEGYRIAGEPAGTQGDGDEDGMP